MTEPKFFEVAWDRHTGVYVRPTEDRIDPGDLNEACAQLEACRHVATTWAAHDTAEQKPAGE